MDVEDRLKAGEDVSVGERLELVEPESRGNLLRHLLMLQQAYLGSALTERDCLEQFPDYGSSVRKAFRQCRNLEWRPPTVGDFIDRYEVRQQLGEGAYGCVYKAWDDELQRWVALKAPRLGASATRSVADDFCHEIRSIAQLRHPNIITIHDVVRDPRGWPLMVLEYLESGSMGIEDDLQDHKLTCWQVIDGFIEVAQALDYLHLQGLVHRDLKPENILTDSQGRVIIADFGLALHCARQEGRSGEIAGTLRYMSPEQVRGETPWIDGRADIWAVGVMLYQRLCGRQPFEGKDRSAIIDAILKRPAKPPRQINPDVAFDLERICLKCLCKSPDDRYATAGDLADDLLRFRRGFRTRNRLPTWRATLSIMSLVVLAAVGVALGPAAHWLDVPATSLGQETPSSDAVDAGGTSISDAAGGTQSPGVVLFDGSAELTYVGSEVELHGDDLIRVNPSRVYEMSVWAKGAVENRCLQAWGFLSFDIDSNAIDHQHVYRKKGAVDTTLAAPIEIGDTEIHLTDATGWASDDSPWWERVLAWYGYTDSTGRVYDDYTYTRNVAVDQSKGLWSSASYDSNLGHWVLVLNRPWSGAPLHRGAAVRNTYLAGYGNKRPIGGKRPLSNRWRRYTQNIEGWEGSDGEIRHWAFRHGTASIRPFLIVNVADNDAAAQVHFRDFTLGYADQREDIGVDD